MTPEIYEIGSDPKYSWIELVSDSDAELMESAIGGDLSRGWSEINLRVMKKDNLHRHPYKYLSDCPTPNFFSPLIVSKQAKKIISEHSNQVTFLPVRISKAEYFIIHKPPVLDVLDRGSEIDYFDNSSRKIRHISKYVFKSAANLDIDLFEIQNFTGHLFVSFVLKEKLENYCKGFQFTDTALYRKSFMTFAKG